MKRGLLFFILLFTIASARATTYYSIASGGWTTASTWSLSSGGSAILSGFPVAGDNVIIEGGFTVSIAASGVENLYAANVTIGTSTNGTLSYPTWNPGSTLTLTGDLTIGGTSGSGNLSYSTWGLTITCARLLKGTGTATRTNPLQQDFIFTGTFTLPADVQFNSFRNFVIDGGGNVSLSGDISTNGSYSPYIYAGSTLDLKSYIMTIGGYQNFNIYGTLIVGGNSGGFANSNFPNSFTTLVIGNNSTVNYSYTGNQSIYPATYNNLTVSGTGVKSNTGTVSSLTLNSGGTGYFCGGETLNFSGGGGSGATGVASDDGNAINSVSITNGGSGYTSAPTVTVSQDNCSSGSGASVTAHITSDLIVNGILTISPSCTLNTGTYNLSLGGSGSIIVNPGGALQTNSVLSNVTLQQSIIAQRGWRMLANPFTTTQTFASLSSTNNVTINTNTGPAGFADTRLFSNSSNAWVDAGTSTTANTAYGLFIRGIKSDISGGGTGLTYAAGPTAFTYSVTGTLNSGNYTVAAPSNSSNFSLIGNPFAAPVNSSELTNGTGISYYLYQIAVSGNGRTKAGNWTSVLSSSTTTPIPVLGVIAWKPSSSYTIHTSGINITNAAASGLFGIETAIPHIELQVEQNGNYQDKLFVRLDPAATATGTDKTDLDKFYNDNVNVYTITNDKNRLAVDARNVLNTIPLGISALVGDYTFKLNNNNLPEGTKVYLNDKLSNTQTELKVGDTYPFSITTDTASHGEQRFSLSFSSKTTALAIDPTGSLTANVLGNITSSNLIAVQISGAQAPVTIAIKDMSGKAISNTNAVNGIQYVHIGNTAAGMLILQISDGKNSVTKKVIKL